jgi:predicted ATPase
LLEGHFVQGQVNFHLGEMTLARGHLHDSVRRYMRQAQPADPSRTVQDTGVAALSYLASALWILGYPDQALARVSEAVEVAQDLKHPLSLVWALNYAAGIHRFRRERPAAAEQLEAAVQLATDQGLPFWIVLGRLLRSWALSQPSQAEKHIAQFKHDLSTWQALGSALGQSNYLALLAEMHEQAGQAEAGLDVLETALKEIKQTGERWYEAELYRLRGEMLLAQEIKGQRSKVKGQKWEEAEAYFEQAIAIAQRQKAKSWELRATLSLSRLWYAQGKSAAAHQQLSAVYAWFSEGFETPDLQEAKALIQTLS